MIVLKVGRLEKINSETFKPLTEEQKTRVDKELLNRLRAVLQEKKTPLPPFQPHTKIVDVNQAFYKEQGEALLRSGKVGCILVAGGQGTRLGNLGPKGCLPITSVKEKTLFQYFAEKVKSASVCYDASLKMAIMTSKQNHAATLAHFITYNNFGLDSSQISFFRQGQLPLLTPKGELFLEAEDKVAFGSDGNGSCFRDFFKSPIAKTWEEEGICYVMFILVDNPLADPFDPYLIGAHAATGVNATLKCIEREQTDEKLGLVVDMGGKARVIEYSEAPHEVWNLKDSDGKLLYSIANISLFCFSLSFLAAVANKELPLHKAFKKSNFVDISGAIIESSEPCAWKFEHFIFDVLDFSHSAQVALYPRNVTFSPVKNKGEIETAKISLTAFDRNVLETITGQAVPDSCLEIDPAFYYPTEVLLSKWRGHPIPDTPYIEA